MHEQEIALIIQISLIRYTNFSKQNIIFIFSGNMSTYEIQPNHIKNDKLRVICLKNEENKRIVENFKKKSFVHTKN